MTSAQRPRLSEISAAVRSAAGQDLAVWSTRGCEGDLVFHVADQNAERIGENGPAIEAALAGALGHPGGFAPGERHPDGTTSFRVETPEAPAPGVHQPGPAGAQAAVVGETPEPEREAG